MNRSSNDSQFDGMAKTFFHYRGLIIRSLSDDINVEYKRANDHVIAGMLTILLIDVGLFWVREDCNYRHLCAFEGEECS